MVSILVILTWTSNSSDMTPKQEKLHHPKHSHGSSVKIWFFLLLEFLGFGTQIKGEQNTVLIVAHFFLNFPNSISLNVSSSQTVCLKMQRNTSSSRNNVIFGSSFHEKLRIIMQSDFFFFFLSFHDFPNFIFFFFLTFWPSFCSSEIPLKSLWGLLSKEFCCLASIFNLGKLDILKQKVYLEFFI